MDDLFEALDTNKDGTIELREWLDHLPRGTRLKVAEKFAPGSALDEYRAIRFTVPTASIVYTYTDEAPMLATHSISVVVLSSWSISSGLKSNVFSFFFLFRRLVKGSIDASDSESRRIFRNLHIFFAFMYLNISNIADFRFYKITLKNDRNLTANAFFPAEISRNFTASSRYMPQ